MSNVWWEKYPPQFWCFANQGFARRLTLGGMQSKASSNKKTMAPPLLSYHQKQGLNTALLGLANTLQGANISPW